MKSTLNIHWKDWCWNKLEYFGHLMWRASSLEKTLMLGKIEVRRRRVDSGWDGWMASLTPWTWAWANSRRQWRTGKPGALLSVGSQRVRKKLLHQTFERISNFECTNFERILILKKLKYITNARNRSSVDNFCVCFFVIVLSCSVVPDSLWLCGQTVAHQTPLSMGFSWQEYWSGLPFPPPVDQTQESIWRLLHLLHCRQVLYC